MKSSCASVSALHFLFPFPLDFNCLRFDMRTSLEWENVWFNNVVLIAIFTKVTSEAPEISSLKSLVRIRNRHVFLLARKTLQGTYSIQVAEFRTFSSFFTDFWKPVVKNFNVTFSFSCSVSVVLLRILTTCRIRDPSSKFPLAAWLSQIVPVFSRTTSFPKSPMFYCSKYTIITGFTSLDLDTHYIWWNFKKT